MQKFRELITHAELLAALSYCPEQGTFTWITTGKGRSKNRKASTLPNSSHGYLTLSINRVSYLQHRLAWFYTYAVWPTQHLDHIDGDKTNNRISNLRAVSDSANAQNMRYARAHSRYGFLGVDFHEQRNKWRSRIHVRGKENFLGYFESALEAHQAYLTAKRNLHEGCTI